MKKFQTIPSSITPTHLVYCEGKFMGTFNIHFGEMSFQQYSNDGDIYDKELAKEFLIEQGADSETFKVKSGQSTKTQNWFIITGRKSK